MTTTCNACGKECDTHEEDHGGYEEVWGARVWHHQYTTVSDCCSDEYTEQDNA